MTGALAFDAPDLDTLLAMQRSSDPEPPSRLVPDVDPALEALILGLMAKDPAKRPSSARAIVAALAEMSAAPMEPHDRRERRAPAGRYAGLQPRSPPAVMADRGWPALVRIFQARATASAGSRAVEWIDTSPAVSSCTSECRSPPSWTARARCGRASRSWPTSGSGRWWRRSEAKWARESRSLRCRRWFEGITSSRRSACSSEQRGPRRRSIANREVIHPR